MGKRASASVNEFDDRPKNPRLYLATHVFQKGLQVGSVLNLTIAPLVYILKNRSLPPLSDRAKYAPHLAAAGVTLSMGLLAKKWQNIDDEGFMDRSWRIKRNKMQNRVDNFALAFGGLGALFGAAKYPALNAANSVAGAALGGSYGIGWGVLAHFISSKFMDMRD
eukprot:Nk52_evm11s252 gene=Nk52_evmTU11s252